MVLKYTSKHISAVIQKSPLNKDIVGFCLKLDPLNRFESEEFEYHPLFPENGILDPWG